MKKWKIINNEFLLKEMRVLNLESKASMKVLQDKTLLSSQAMDLL